MLVCQTISNNTYSLCDWIKMDSLVNKLHKSTVWQTICGWCSWFTITLPWAGTSFVWTDRRITKDKYGYEKMRYEQVHMSRAELYIKMQRVPMEIDEEGNPSQELLLINGSKTQKERRTSTKSLSRTQVCGIWTKGKRVYTIFSKGITMLFQHRFQKV